jgi:hypothetical protein
MTASIPPIKSKPVVIELSQAEFERLWPSLPVKMQEDIIQYMADPGVTKIRLEDMGITFKKD